MPINHGNRWSPDTCGCSLNLGFDDTLPVEERVVTYLTQEEVAKIYKQVNGREPDSDWYLSTKEKVCSKHKNKSGQDLLSTLLVENQQINQERNK